MLDLDKLNKLTRLTVDRVMRDYPEGDKILIAIDQITTEAIIQHAKIIKAIEKTYNIKITEDMLNKYNELYKQYNP